MKEKKKAGIIVYVAVTLLLFFVNFKVIGQTVDTLLNSKRPFMGGMFIEPEGIKHSPKKAMLLSFAFPGAGQFYNKQYYKIPFVWGAVGGMGYWAYYNNRQYKFFRDLYRARVNNLPLAQDTLVNVSDAVIVSVRDKYRKTMEQAYFLGIVVYLLNGVEAFTAAHLLDFDISENLTLRISPEAISTQAIAGVPTVGFGVRLVFEKRQRETPHIFETFQP